MSLKLYNLFIHIYGVLIRVAALFNPKARRLLRGRKAIFANLEGIIVETDRYVWFHCASLGEFEQGRPVIERFRETYPEFKILLTFYSPSGFEVRKSYKKVDIVSYLPLDTADNANRFLNIVKPELAVFVKYEFWPNILFGLKKRKIPAVSVSAIFRQNQVYFWDFGQFFKDVLKTIDHYFVQDKNSVQLLENIGINNAIVAGDTRFDRVLDLASQPVKFQEIATFKGEKPCFIAGSTWEADEDLILDYFLSNDDWKVVIVPHEVQPAHLSSLMEKCQGQAVLHSTAPENLADIKILIIDTIGKLSKIYKYADVSYVGGGFGKGLHNVLEPAVWGVPIIIGPHYQKFKEAKGLVDLKAAIPVVEKEDFPKIIKKLSDPEKRAKKGKAAKEYVEQNAGATQVIVAEIGKILEGK